VTTLRPATVEDLPSLARGVTALTLFRRYHFHDPRVLQLAWEEALRKGELLWVAEQSGEPVGVAWFLRQGAFGMGAYLRTLAVVDPAQGRGVGAKLLQTFEAQTREAPGGWFLLVSDFNLDAQRFYSRWGYHPVGRLPGLVIPDVAELLFWKPRAAD
jgi:GNAT superfamily N-acetyltransferase